MMSKQNVPELRFPEFSGEWEERTLENISNIYDGTHATPDYVSEGIPFFSVENVSRKDFVNSKYVSREAYEVYKKRVEVEFNDILMTRIGSIGNVKRVDWHFPSTFYVSLALLKLKKGFVPKYIEQLLKSLTVQKNIVRNSLVTAVPQKINLVDLKQVKINLATSKSEQLKIGEFLSKVDRLIELEEKKLELLEEQKKGYMQKIFSQELRFKDENGNDYPEWEEKKLGEIADITMGQSPKGSSYSENSNDTILVQGNADMKYGKVIPRIFTSQPSKLANRGDILLSVRAPVGEICITQYDVCIGRGVASIKGDKFIYYFLDYFNKSNQWQSISQGSTFESISGNDIRSLTLFLPTKKEEKKISTFLNSLDDLIKINKNKLEALKRRKQGLLQKMFL